MTPITTTLPDHLLREVDRAAQVLDRTREQLLCDALEVFLEDLDDATQARARLEDASDELLDWSDVRRDLLDSDQG